MRFGTLVVEEEGGRRRAAGVFSGQVDEGEGVDEQQAARGPRQGRGGSWRPLEGGQGGQGSSHSLGGKVRRRRALLVRVILGVVGDVRSYRLRTAGWKTSWRACATLKNPRATRRSAVRRG